MVHGLNTLIALNELAHARSVKSACSGAMDRTEPDQGIKPFGGEVTDSMIDDLIDDDDRSGVWRVDAAVSRVPATEKDAAIVSSIREALRRYHDGLNARRHGDVLAHAFAHECETILDQRWKQSTQTGVGTAR